MAGYKFRILLDSKDRSEIFRDIVIADSKNLEELYQLCVQSFEFAGNQMASFYVSDHDWNKGQEITLVDMGWRALDEEYPENSEEILTMSQVKISDIVRESNQRLILVYDFIRMWIFLIELVEIIEQTPIESFVAFSVGEAPQENKERSNDLSFETIIDLEKDDIFETFTDYDFSEFENFDDLNESDNSYFDSYEDTQDY